LVINFMTGFVATMAFVIMNSIESTKPLAKAMRYVFVFFPPYNLGEGLLRLSASFFTNTILGGNVKIFSWECVGGPLVLMACEALGYVLVTMLLETRVAKVLGHAADQLRVRGFMSSVEQLGDAQGEDEDVAAEAARVRRLHAALAGQQQPAPPQPLQGGLGGAAPRTGAADWTAATILLDGLHKVYPPPVTHAASEAFTPAAAFHCGMTLCGAAPHTASTTTSGGSSSSGSGSRNGGGNTSREQEEPHQEQEEQQQQQDQVVGAAGPRHKHAVRGLSLAVPKGETFGFLGINGAGKTTTLSILTGDLLKTRGAALVNGADVGDPSTQRSIGYCPQEDPLLDLMTGEETLLLFARLKGVGGGDEKVLVRTARGLLKKVGLLKFKDEPCGGYSGGMKRKLR
jgi:ABC-type glutathione transport system ATPase component